MILLNVVNSSTPFWQILLGSAIISAVISGAFNLKIQKQEFNYNYKKYILNKRIDAYEALLNLMKDLFEKVVIKIGDNNEFAYYNFFIAKKDSPDSRLDFSVTFSKLNENTIWYSTEMKIIIMKTCSYLMKLDDEIKNSTFLGGYFELIKPIHKHIDDFQISFIRQYFQDMENLPRIKFFTNNVKVS